MTLIKDMSETQRQAWITLIVDVTVFVYFFRRATTSWRIDTLEPRELSLLFIGVIIATVIMHIIIQSIFAARAHSEEEDLKDERDVRIERKGAASGFYFLALCVNLIIGHIVLQNGIDVYPETAKGYRGLFDYTNTSHLVFALLFAAFMADIIKNSVMVSAYHWPDEDDH